MDTSRRNKKSDDTNGTTTTIALGRYTFDKNTGTPSEPKIDGTVLEDEAGYKYTEDTKTNTGKSSYGNAIAKDIDTFISSSEGNGGYYLARYEAGVTNYDEKNIKTSNSGYETNWTGYQANAYTTLKLVSKKDQQVWNFITQNKASELAQGMYTSGNFTSDLTNSYAWDTAIVFIQKYSGDTDYSRENRQTFSSSLRNTGAGTGADGDKIDKVCNIYDMARNCAEWTTEIHSGGGHCTIRGGVYDNADYHTAIRASGGITTVYRSYSFRPVLYVALNTRE